MISIEDEDGCADVDVDGSGYEEGEEDKEGEEDEEGEEEEIDCGVENWEIWGFFGGETNRRWIDNDFGTMFVARLIILGGCDNFIWTSLSIETRGNVYGLRTWSISIPLRNKLETTCCEEKKNSIPTNPDSGISGMDNVWPILLRYIYYI